MPDEFPGYPVGIRAGQLPDPTLKSYFLTLFGRSERVTACACERNGEVTHAAAAAPAERRRAWCDKIRAGDGRLAKLLKDEQDRRAEIVEELFLATLSRPPTDGGEGGGASKALSAKDAEPRRGLSRPVLGAAELEGVLVQSLMLAATA